MEQPQASQALEWRVDDTLIGYEEALTFMEARAAAIRDDDAAECVWLLEHKKRGPDVRRYVHSLEEWVIRTLAVFNVRGERREGRPGVWVRRTDIGAPSREDKIAALGVRVRRWVTLHGLSINLEPDLSHYNGIVPCGIAEHGVTSLSELGVTATIPELDMALRDAFEEVFGDG